VTGYCEYSNESSGSIKDGEYLHKLSDYELFKKDSVPCSFIARSMAKAW
jgi:hypothetical protein